MIFVDNNEERSKTHERFAYRNKNNDIELVEANVNHLAVVITDNDGESVNTIYYEDIPKLILALQAAYDFKFKENT